MILKELRRVFAILSLIMALPVFSFAQDEGQFSTPVTLGSNDKFYKYSIQGGAGITYALTNPAFLRDYANGVYAINLAVDAAITPRLYIGVEGHNDQFGQALPLYGIVNPLMNMYMGGGRIGYHSSTANTLLFNATISAGVVQIIYSGAPVPNPPKGGIKQQTEYGTINLMELYKVDDQFWAGIYVGGTYMPYIYNPYTIGIGQFYPYVKSDYSGPTAYISWGIQAFYVFGKK